MLGNRKAQAAGMGFLVGIVALAALGLAKAEQKKPVKKAPGVLRVCNEAGKETTLAEAAWKKLPRQKVSVKGRGGAKVAYEGVALVDVLRHAEVPFGKHLRGPGVAMYVLTEAADGYRAVFALAEIDPSTTDQVILVADRKDGKPLATADGPYRLIVPKDKIHSRWVKQVTKITVQSAAGKKAK